MITVFHAGVAQRSKYEEGMAYLVKLRNEDFAKFVESMSYNLVAFVDTDNLSNAFELTNHIDWDWWINKGVTTIRRSRSTSVGDMLIFNNKIYIVEQIGFKEIEISS